jgi:hypothetical protein
VALLDIRSVHVGRHRFRQALLLFDSVLGARAKFDRAIAVVVSLHRQTANTVAFLTALPIMPGTIAEMAVAHLSPLLLATANFSSAAVILVLCAILLFAEELIQFLGDLFRK